MILVVVQKKKNLIQKFFAVNGNNEHTIGHYKFYYKSLPPKSGNEGDKL